MAQSPAFLYSDDDAVDYTPAAAVVGGDVVVQAGIIGITPTDLAASEKGSLATEGIYDVPAAIRHAILMLCSHWYETRGATVATGAVPQDVPFGVMSLLDSVRWGSYR